jgi:Xaa-Pro dipeptidase
LGYKTLSVAGTAIPGRVKMGRRFASRGGRYCLNRRLRLNRCRRPFYLRPPRAEKAEREKSEENAMNSVPEEEIQQRVGKFQSYLFSRNLQGALIFQNVDRYYFSGTIQSSILFVPAQGLPVLMTLKGYERARMESSLENIVPIADKDRIKDVLADYTLEKAGLEIDVLPAYLYLWLRETFPGCRWEDVSRGIRRLRMIKSPYEVNLVKKAARILHLGYTELAGILHEGMTELEIDGHLALIARREGHMGILRMRGWNQEMTYAHVLSGESGSVVSFLDSPHGGSGNTPAMAQGAGFRRIGRDEPIGVDYGAGVEGYVADQFRTFVIGDLDPELIKAHDCSARIHRLFAETAQPGTSCADLYRMAVEEAAKAGLADYFMGHGEGQVKFIGHGIGLEIDELPIIAPFFDQKLEPGMVIAFEPKFVFPGRGVVGMEDDYVVTSSGVERITLTEQKMICL